jgi:opacity protein-like surface antigen
MKKIYLYAAIASVITSQAQAADWSMHDKWVSPYIGADYIYSHADISGEARGNKKDYNSWAVNVGAEIAKYMDIEAFFQQAGERKSHLADGRKLKSEFYAWGMDLYGKMPIGCAGFHLFGSAGLADYNVKYKHELGSEDKQRVGYRGGVGFGYNFTENVSMRVMGRYTYLGMRGLDNLMEVTAGLRYTF